MYNIHIFVIMTSSSPFANFVPEGFDYYDTFNDENAINAAKYTKHVEFAVFRLPCMIDSHASSPLTASKKNNRNHKRSSSIVVENVGIVNVQCKTVSFSPNIRERLFKADRW
jgi:hypothetical protein